MHLYSVVIVDACVIAWCLLQRDTRRQSIAFFHNVNRDVTVKTIPTCIDAEHPEKYPPINAFEHLMERHARATGAGKAYEGETKA
jgi:isopenicillin N synthase-like dioxygenase